MVEWNEDGYSGKRLQQVAKDETECSMIVAELNARGIPYLVNYIDNVSHDSGSSSNSTDYGSGISGSGIGISNRGNLSVEISDGVGMTANGKLVVGGIGGFGGI